MLGRVPHHSTREYAGCPNCGAPVNVGVEVNLALAYYLSAMVPHVSGKAREVVDEMARYLGEEAFEAIQDSDEALRELRELVANDAEKPA
jgi:hypothetical protein